MKYNKHRMDMVKQRDFNTIQELKDKNTQLKRLQKAAKEDGLRNKDTSRKLFIGSLVVPIALSIIAYFIVGEEYAIKYFGLILGIFGSAFIYYLQARIKPPQDKTYGFWEKYWNPVTLIIVILLIISGGISLIATKEGWNETIIDIMFSFLVGIIGSATIWLYQYMDKIKKN